MTALVIVERQPGGVDELSLQALSFARTLVPEPDVHALVVGKGGSDLGETLGHHGAEHVHFAEPDDAFSSFAPQAVARTAAELSGRLSARFVIAAGSERGNEVVARVGALLDQPFAANCIQATAGEPVVVLRQRWGGSLLEEAELDGAPALLTLAPHVFAAAPPDRGHALVEGFAPRLTADDLVVRVVEHVREETAGVSLTDAKVVVSAGRGAGSAEGFGIIEELAGLLGGAVGCSRAVTMAGWRPHTDQVGQTGTKIAPDIYIACGISGATQHMAGCKGAKRILAINTDPDASIMASADYAVIGDLHEVVPAVSAELRKARGQ